MQEIKEPQKIASDGEKQRTCMLSERGISASPSHTHREIMPKKIFLLRLVLSPNWNIRDWEIDKCLSRTESSFLPYLGKNWWWGRKKVEQSIAELVSSGSFVLSSAIFTERPCFSAVISPPSEPILWFLLS